MKEWNVLKSDEDIINKLSVDLNVSKEIGRLLVLRGITNYEDAESFFRPSLKKTYDPFLMKGMGVAVQRLNLAKSDNQNILVYGDYDVDGITSVAMMYMFLLSQGINVKYYIPDRHEEGYGISRKGIDYAAANEISLVISLDCGIRAVDQIDYAQQYKIDFIICDHHTPSNKTPNAYAILNPKQLDCKYPNKDLSGCGVGFKLITAYASNNCLDINETYNYLDLLAISIVSDMVPITGENRIYAFHGLKKINNNPSVGIKSLISISNRSNEIRSSDILFGIAPLINAAGRISHAKEAVNLLIEKCCDKAKVYAENLCVNNEERKEIEKRVFHEASQMINKEKMTNVVYAKNWHKGVVGIVASKLIEVHYRPTIVFAEINGILTGSARSVKGFDIYESIKECSFLCERFGGHKYAAGLSVRQENIKLFVEKFEEVVANKIKKYQLTPVINVDIDLELNQINQKLFRIIKQFSPFGPGNLKPIFSSSNVQLDTAPRYIGKNKSHVKLRLSHQSCLFDAIAFGFAEFFLNNNNNQLDLCYTIDENNWNGKKSLQINIKDVS
jgi:single-stranded-DNA-specific exonuclease